MIVRCVLCARFFMTQQQQIRCTTYSRRNGSVMMKGKMSDEIFLEIFVVFVCRYVRKQPRFNGMKAISRIRVYENKTTWNSAGIHGGCVFWTTCKSERKIVQSINTFNWCASVKLAAIIYSGRKSNGNYSKKRFHHISIANFAANVQLCYKMCNSDWRELWYLSSIEMKRANEASKCKQTVNASFQLHCMSYDAIQNDEMEKDSLNALAPNTRRNKRMPRISRMKEYHFYYSHI